MAEGKGAFTSELTASFNQTLDWKKLVVAAAGIAIGVAFYRFFDWLAGVIDQRISEAWDFVPWIVTTLGNVIMLYVITAAMVGVAGMVFAAAKGGKGGTLGAGFSMMFGKLFTVLMATLGFGVLYAVALLPIWVIGWLGRIPAAGPYIFGAAAFLAILGALFGAFVLFRFAVTMYVLPAIIAGGERGRAAFKEGKRLFFRQALPLVRRWLVVVLVVVMFLSVVGLGLRILQAHTRITAYNNADTMASAPVLRVVPHWTGEWSLPIRFVFQNPFELRHKLETSRQIGGWFFGIEYAIIGAILLALPLVFFTVSGCHSYAALKQEPEEPIRVPEVDLSKIKQAYESRAEAFRSRVREEMGEGERKGGSK